MTYDSDQAFRRALEQRLMNRARETGLPIVRLRREVTFEALLNRLTVVAPGRWLLKGGLALDLRLSVESRTTKDMDLARSDSEEAATHDFAEAQNLNIGDHFVFTITRSQAPADAGTVRSVRYNVRTEMAARLFENVVVDVGFGDPQPDAVEIVSTPGLLAFAGIPPVRVPTLPITQHVAEKLHAYTRNYQSGSSSRVKDLVDIVLIASHYTIEAGELRRALDATFAIRRQHNLPASLPRPDSQWATAYRKLAREVGIDEEIEVGFREAVRFLDPVLRAAVGDGACWNTEAREWEC